MIFCTGDIHGDPRRFSVDRFPEQKEMTRDDFVIILGDFGLVWSNSKDEKYWLDWLDDKPFTTLFVDGNHENFDLLYTYPVVDYHGGKAHKIRDNVYHLMRGYVFDIDGKTFFTFGGARSHDISDGILDPMAFDDTEEFKKLYHSFQKHGKMFRVKGFSWWEQEMPNDEELERGRQSLKEKIHFIEISYGSLMEVFCELQTACDLGYMTEEQLDNLRPQFTDIAKMLSGLRSSLEKRL